MASETTDVVVAERAGFGMTVRKAANLEEREWSDERIKAIKETVAPPGTSLAQLAIFLATAAQYGLNPMLREIWLADMRQSDESGDRSGPPRYSVVTGRDAFVKVMNNQPDFRGLVCGVVYAKDTFNAEREDGKVSVVHTMPGIDRGEAVGAYAIIRREGKPDVFVSRIKKQFAHLMRKKSWVNYLDEMLETRVIVTAARRAYNLAGLEELTVAEDVAAGLDPMVVATGDAERGTSDMADALRGRIAAVASRVKGPVSDAPEVVDVGPAVTEEVDEVLEARLRFEELEQLKKDDPDAYEAAMERLAIEAGEDA